MVPAFLPAMSLNVCMAATGPTAQGAMSDVFSKGIQVLPGSGRGPGR